MSQSSPRAELPYLQAAQAQKHVTHNEALQRLDALTQLCLRQLTSNSPPAQPAAGDLYGIGSTPSGAWAGQAGAIAYWTGTSWLFLQPQEGWRAWDLSTQALRVWRVEEGGVGGSWQPSFARLDQLDGLGLGTVSDAQNPLSLPAPASLFSHAGAGHQLKINRASDTERATVLFQSDWTGHAEMGLATGQLGDRSFVLKLSSDGSAWQEVLRGRGCAIRSCNWTCR